MAESTKTKGACIFCGREFTRGGMGRHLRACPARKAAIEAADQGAGTVQPVFHLQVQDMESGTYWLQLEMSGQAQLRELDRYLRAIWLECCDHLSQFTAGGWGSRELPMSRRAESVLEPGAELVHIYDFGTSSYTLIRVADMRRGKPLSRHPIYLMARNHAPDIQCIECGQAAAWVCRECLYEYDEFGALCDEHARTHPHTEYGHPLPLVNSPRIGMCGYAGPAEPPY